VVDWQVTATTIRCDVVKDEVTLLVYKDWSVKCTGRLKYTNVRRTSRNGRIAACEENRCELAKEYCQKLQNEESHI
jgi:hypothetical protein